MKAPLIQNETSYDGRTVSGIVRWVFRRLDLNGRGVMVKVKHHDQGHGYSGRCYIHARMHRSYVYSHSWGMYQEVGPVVPPGVDHLIVCRIGKPGCYPTSNHVYSRVDGPEPWMLADWQEALVSVTGHEAKHLDQWRRKGKRGGRYGRFNETATEWAALSCLKDWKQDKGRS